MSNILRRRLLPLLASCSLLAAAAPAQAAADAASITRLDSPHPFAETVSRIEKAINANGLTLFARIDHAAAAKKAGLEMKPTEVLVFGNPKGGTPLMQQHPLLALDLPLKALVWQGDDGKVSVALNGAAFYRQRHDLPEAPAQALGGAAAMVEKALK